METKILKAVFGGGTSTVTNKRTRTDYGQVLEIIGIDLPDTFECIFSNSNTSVGVGKKMIGSSQRVLIPDEYLTTGQTIYAWILLHDTEDDGRHMYSIKIPVADMPDTSPEEPTPVEQSVISQAITALNSAVTTTSQKAQEASASADRAEHAAEGAEGYAERAESAQQAAESARDRATQAEISARTSAATATEKASEAISSATTSSQSALTAENASESARASATASAESASQASQSADTASGKASDASEYASNANTSAQTASQKASEAAQSAQTASQAKTDAETAKQASETAQGLAESARDDAITAKTSAESARDEAQSIADGITGKVEQIDSNTDRIESLEDDRYKPYVVDTASGSVASFPDGADDIPLKSCIVQIEPVQDLHGYDSPWPAGGGKNLIPFPYASQAGTYNGITVTVNNDGTLVLNGTSTSSVFFDLVANSRGIPLKAGSYILHRPMSNGISGVNITAVKNGAYWSDATLDNISLTLDEDANIAWYIRVVSGKTLTNEKIYPMFEAGTTASEWSPYENICPISGWTGMEIEHTGKNLLNADTYYGDYKQSDGSYLLSDSNLSIILIPLKTFIGKTITFSAEATIGETTNLRVRAFINGRATNGTPTTNNATSTISLTATPVTDNDYIHITYGSGGSNPVTLRNVQLEEGPAVTTYESFGQTYPITFPSEEGTVYGAYVDVIKGELVVDRAMVELPSDMGWDTWGVNYRTSGITGFYIYRRDMPSTSDFSNIGKAVLTNLLPINEFIWGGTVVGYATNTHSTSDLYEMVSIHNESVAILSTDTKEEAVAKFKTFLASTPLNVLYELAEPIHYPLTPIEIKTLLGQNNLWADTGNSDVEYRADVTLYINKKITEAVSALS